ncbi:DUF6161 domain-containing protein [Sphingobacterium sp. BIGb0116]|uniref:DUF6161 domain-containing protein n=1 Tax=Sphingobacterium sp. BIGb0116 TaxID=2940619 RepID=UPI002168D338|nr:DUF6161 domain-containing protein [Sphingobacterium sp. BIGb0116]MCS4164241.1 hypothetical protein [Sphingobacterium sp. BIGb0116]
MALPLQEARDLISNSVFLARLNDLNCTISYPYLNIQFELKGFYNIYKYFYDQFVGWEKIKTTSPNILLNSSYNYFKDRLVSLQNFIKVELQNQNQSESSIILLFNRDILGSIKNLRNTTPFPFDSPEVDFLISLNSTNSNRVDAAYYYFIGSNQSINSTHALEGTIMAYEFRNQDNSNIFNRRVKEKTSFDRLRSRFEGLSNNYENELTAHISKLKQDFKVHTDELDEFKTSKEKSVADWFISEKGAIEKFRKESQDNIDNIQASYRSKVELDEPIKHWTKRARELRVKGNWLLMGILSVSLVFAFAVYLLLWHTPADLMISIFNGDKGAAVRWSIIFVIFVSIFFVVARALLKFMFSNYHLARDAEEREKLTYLYLSMIENGALDKEERKIILQSLFSRSDTGLLKEESSPTMPNISSLISKP